MASSKEIEREVESQRATVESTLGALRDKMSVSQIVDEVGSYVGAEDARVAFRNVGRQVRDNPIAFGLVGVGLAWLMLGSGGRSRSYDDGDGDWRSTRYPGADDSGSAFSGPEAEYAAPGAPGGQRFGSGFGSPYEPNGSQGESDDMSREGSMVSRAAKAVGGAVSSVTDAVSGAGGTISDAVSGASRQVRSAGSAGRDRMHAMRGTVGERLPSADRLMEHGERAGDELADIVERQPLLVGAVAAAIGVAIGAALPSTRVEDRWVGQRRDDVLEGAKRTAQDLKHQAVDAAKAGLHAAADAAKEEGLTPEAGGKTVAERVENVVRSAVGEAKQTLESAGAGDPAARQG